MSCNTYKYFRCVNKFITVYLVYRNAFFNILTLISVVLKLKWFV